MSKHGSARTVLAGAAVVTLAGAILAGCTGVPKGARPQVPGQTTGVTGSAGSTPAAGSSPASPGSSAAPASSGGASSGNGGQSATSVGGNRQNGSSASFAKANSIPFPVAIGNTWVYRTQAAGQTGRTTNRIVAASPGSTGYRVTVSSSTSVAGTATAVSPVYVFYPDGSVGYPVPPVNGVSVTGGGVRWPNAAGLASGRPYHSTVQIQDGRTGQRENANVTVQGAGTTDVTVPAGTYHVSVIETSITAKGVTVRETTWIAQGVGPVKTEVMIQAAGGTGLTTTSELLSFTKAVSVVGDGS